MHTVDYVLGIDADAISSGNELAALGSLATGLAHLNEVVSALEAKVSRSGKRILFAMSGDTVGLSSSENALLPSLFHWYSVSAVNYARLVGFLGGLKAGEFSRQALEDDSQYKRIAEYCDTYVTSVPELGALQTTRNKVAAHFAVTAPRKKSDNIALLDLCLFPIVGFESSRFRANLFEFSRTDSAGNSYSAALPPWSLTEVHSSLRPRYWPART